MYRRNYVFAYVFRNSLPSIEANYVKQAVYERSLARHFWGGHIFGSPIGPREAVLHTTEYTDGKRDRVDNVEHAHSAIPTRRS